MEQGELITRLEAAAREIPHVEAVEVWSSGGATRVRDDDTESNPFQVIAVPPETSFMDPELIAGQWLASAGSIPNAVVVNSDLVDAERGVDVGRDIVLDIDGRESTWRVAGIVGTESRGAAAYVRRDDYAYAVRLAGQGNRVQVRIEPGSVVTQDEMAAQLREHLDAAGLKVSDTQTSQMTQAENNLLFTIVVAFLILMALLLAAVGGLGLSTTMSINMMERVREVGVLRAIGASNASVSRIVLAEGIAMSVISWVMGVGLSILIAPVLSDQLGLALIKIPLQYRYAVLGAGIWFFILLGIAAVASLAPARDAVRLTVREVLAYE